MLLKFSISALHVTRLSSLKQRLTVHKGFQHTGSEQTWEYLCKTMEPPSQQPQRTNIKRGQGMSPWKCAWESPVHPAICRNLATVGTIQKRFEAISIRNGAFAKYDCVNCGTLRDASHRQWAYIIKIMHFIFQIK